MKNLYERIKIRYLTNERKIADKLDIDRSLLRDVAFDKQEISDELGDKIKKEYRLNYLDKKDDRPLSLIEKHSNELTMIPVFFTILMALFRLVERTFFNFELNNQYILGLIIFVVLDFLAFGLMVVFSVFFRKNLLSRVLWVLALLMLFFPTYFDVYYLICQLI